LMQGARTALYALSLHDALPISLNVCGAVALERGGINEATLFFTRAQEEAMQDNDMASVGRCANNLGIIANLQGDYGRAVGAYTRSEEHTSELQSIRQLVCRPPL